MSGSYLLRKNKGFLLVSAYIGVLVLVILGVALFGRTIHEHKFATITMDELSARYAAERGIEYAITELKLNTNFKTHYTQEGPTGVFSLMQQAAPVSPQLANVIVDGSGCYASQFPAGDSQFTTKIYADPYLIGETIILSKGLSNGQTCLLVTKYVPSSLYRFFIFTPFDFWPGGSYDAGGGSIHANGAVYFTGGTVYSNIHELSTAKFFKYYIDYFVPPQGDATTATGATIPNPRNPGFNYTWDDVFYNYRYPFRTGNTTSDPNLKYKNNTDGYARGSYQGLIWEHPTDHVIRYLGQSYPALPPGMTPENYILDPADPLNLGRYACNNYASSCTNDQLSTNHTVVNNIKIPNYFTTGYDYNKYWHLADQGTTSPWYRFSNYWAYTAENMTQYAFNSQYQSLDWKTFLVNQHAPGNGPTLDGVLKDQLTDGAYIQPLSIQGAFYSQKADSGGITITYSVADGVKVKIKNYNNSNPISLNESGGHIDINSVANVFEQKSFVDQISAETKDVVTLDIGKLKQALGNNAGLDQNIIYSNYPIVLTNARDILDSGLTTVCENHIYLHGNYNDQPTTGGETFKPSSAISGRRIYTLSGSWDYPQTLQYTFHNPDYPNKHDFYCPAGDATCINNLIAGGRRSDQTTDPSYPGGYNWYALYHDQMTHAVPPDSDPLAAGNNPYVYNVALVGQSAYPEVLERWWDYTNPGNNNTQPSSAYATTRQIYGAQIFLESTDFPGSGAWSNYIRRCCGTAMPGGGTFSAPCADCATYVDSWPTPVYGSTTSYNYNTQFADGDVPPGDLLGYSSTVFMELEDNTTNWTKHYNLISMR